MLSCRGSPRATSPSAARSRRSRHRPRVEAGRFAAIIGRSGSGKSSLMAMIGGLSRPSDGRSSSTAPTSGACRTNALAAFRNRRIGFVFQFASLLPTLRLIDNVALPALLGKRRPAADAYAQGRGACWAAWACATISTPIRRRSPPASSAAP